MWSSGGRAGSVQSEHRKASILQEVVVEAESRCLMAVRDRKTDRVAQRPVLYCVNRDDLTPPLLVGGAGSDHR
jgi:hypothetical protein